MDSSNNENSGPVNPSASRGSEFLALRFLDTEASSTPLHLLEMPESIRTAVDRLAQDVFDPDGGRVLVIGYPFAGKSFFIEQLSRNVDFYLEKSSLKNLVFIPLSITELQLIESTPGKYPGFVRSLERTLAVKEQEICFVTEHVEVAATIATYSQRARIILETNITNFVQLTQIEQSGRSKLWSSWAIFDVNDVYCTKAELVDTLYAGLHDKLEAAYGVNITRKHILVLINYFLRQIPELKGEGDYKNLIMAPPGIWGATVRRLAGVLGFSSDAALYNDRKEKVFARVVSRVFEEMSEIFQEITHSGDRSGGFSAEGSPLGKMQQDLLESMGFRFVSAGAPDALLPGQAPEAEEEQDDTPKFKDINTLAARLKTTIFGQDRAVEAVADSFLAPAAGLNEDDKPVRSLLFLGPTGVGKTKMALALAEELMEEPLNVVRLDMSEYSQKHESVKLLGAPPGYVGHGRGGVLTNALKANPYSLVLLDEIEKADPDIWDTFLQVLDAGRMTDGDGETVDFSQAVIVMTSNLGTKELNRRTSGFTTVSDADQYAARTASAASTVKKAVEEFLKPEFINRIDDQVIFTGLSNETTKEIAAAELELIAARAEEQGFRLAKPKDDILNEVLKLSDVSTYGAREIQRVVRRTISNKVARLMLDPQSKKKRLKLVLDEHQTITVKAT